MRSCTAFSCGVTAVAESNISIATSQLSADIHPFGAQLFALRDAEGRDLLWNGDPAFWTSRAPILFPIIGELAGGQYRLGEERYRLPRHGFARSTLFTLVESSPSSAVFRLTSNEQTLGVYPFLFTLDIGFALDSASLAITALVKNLGPEVMPASFGFHPALRWPLPYGQARADHRVLFAQDEPSPIRRLTGDGLVRPEPVPTPVEGRQLQLRDALFEKDALIFDQPASRSLRYGAPGGPQIDVTFDGMPYLGLWTKPGAGFICIEPWHGMADPENYSGDIRDKPGIVLIPPGATQRGGMTISLTGQPARAMAL